MTSSAGKNPWCAARLLALPVLLAGALLAGCGGSSPGARGTAGERSQEAQSERRDAEFAKCLREHGIHAEVVSSPGEGHGLKVGPSREGEGGGPAESAAAERDCARFEPRAKQVNLSPQQKVEREEAVQRFARCMREHGIEVEASATGDGIKIGIRSHGAAGEPNPRSPGFQRAQSACQKLLPGRGPGAGRPGSAKAGG